MEIGERGRAITVHDICWRAVREQQPNRRRCFLENLTHYGQSRLRRRQSAAATDEAHAAYEYGRAFRTPIYIRKEDYFLKRL